MTDKLKILLHILTYIKTTKLRTFDDCIGKGCKSVFSLRILSVSFLAHVASDHSNAKQWNWVFSPPSVSFLAMWAVSCDPRSLCLPVVYCGQNSREIMEKAAICHRKRTQIHFLCPHPISLISCSDSIRSVQRQQTELAFFSPLRIHFRHVSSHKRSPFTSPVIPPHLSQWPSLPLIGTLPPHRTPLHLTN